MAGIAVYHVDCYAVGCANNKGGECIALTECLMSDGRMCPFYKTKERANAEIIECIDHKTKKYAAKAKRAKK